MSITSSEMAAEVAANLEIDADTTSYNRLKVYKNLSLAQLDLLNILPLQYLRDGMKTVLFNLEQLESEYQWPADFIRFVALWLDYDAAIVTTGSASLNPGKPVTQYDPDNFQVPITDVGSAEYPFVDISVQDGYIIHPAPSDAQTDGGRLRYVYKPADLSESQSSPLNPNLKSAMVFRGTALSCLVDDYRPDMFTRFNKMYLDAIAPMLPKEEPNK
jgi:hypothetical protein